jgi:transcriptional regulator with XRE-family HTH domain
MNFHKRLRKLQGTSGLTFKAIADACGVSYQTVQQWAKDDGTFPKIENLEPLASVLKTTPWYLLFGVHATGESSNRGQLPPLSDEAEELIQCVIRLDGDDGLTRKLFEAHTGLLLLALAHKLPDDAQAGLDMPPLLPSPDQDLVEAERHAQDVLSRGHISGGKHAGPKRGGR